jgi:putative ABC transport system ATP-binding protein
MKAENAVELVSVSKRYRLGATEVVAVREVSLVFAAGEFAAITGPSGSGKTTLLNIMGCLDAPSSGQVKIAGADASGLGERELDRLRSRSIGFIFQSFNLVPVLNAVENVMLPLHLHGLRAAEMRRQGLEAQAGFLPDQMSGGQRQRVSIARALVTGPRLVLADEPTANLDSANADAIVELMRQLNRERQVTFVFSTHDASLLGKVDRVVRLRDGRLQDAAPRLAEASA